ncbi:hypothetical protein [Hymenobacter canadensis]|uniref:DUF4294 domain-containing protein n=1 Tax=Hymenobacter canadensis TaxID=2999067 RepID=A0ABY7LY37_9BACT|nr:hypothetical protein [Hymenobacter canadensis]WBA44317.1 hypothetical protein O3303_21155 [Hymenobacter canadensis]
MYRVNAWLLGLLLLLANPALAFSLQPLPKNSEDPTTQYFTYRNEQIVRLRATEKDLKKGGGATFIKEMEAILETCYARLHASNDGPVYEMKELFRFELLTKQIHAARPKWSTLAHEQEFAFYQREDLRRAKERNKAAELQARIAARARHTADSLQQIVLARRHRIELDSLAALAKVQAIEEAEENRLVKKAYDDSVYFSHPGLVELDRRNGFRGLKFGSPLSSLGKQAKRIRTIDQDIVIYEIPG